MSYFSANFNFTNPPTKADIDRARKRLAWGRPMTWLGLVLLSTAILAGFIGVMLVAKDNGQSESILWLGLIDVVCIFLLFAVGKLARQLNESAEALCAIESYQVENAIKLAQASPEIDEYRRRVVANRTLLMGDYELMYWHAERQETILRFMEAKARDSARMARLHDHAPLTPEPSAEQVGKTANGDIAS